MISRRVMVSTLAAALAGASSPALAASRANPIKMFDTDNDGTLDLAEVKKAASGLFASWIATRRNARQARIGGQADGQGTAMLPIPITTAR